MQIRVGINKRLIFRENKLRPRMPNDYRIRTSLFFLFANTLQGRPHLFLVPEIEFS